MLLLVALLFGLTGCSAGGDPVPPPDTGADAAPSESASPDPPEEKPTLTLGVFGPPAEIQAWRRVIRGYGGADIELLTARTHQGLQRRIEGAGHTPDVFLSARRELGRLVPEGVTRPVGDLLAARGMGFGDSFSRRGLQAFSAEDALQCMPWEISPQVVFVNTELVDFERMLELGLAVPSSSFSWSLEEFSAAARFASQPLEGVKGVHVPINLAGLAPFVYAGGGQVYNDDEQPTSLAFSSDDSQEALAEVLPVLRNPRTTLSEEELAEKGPVDRFVDGQLGMLVGNHSLIPQFRAADGLEFDVRMVPRISQTATAGQISGLCLAASSSDTAAAADLLVHLTSPDSVAAIVRQGYTVPANLNVLGSTAFTAPGQMPEHARVFVDALRYQEFGPEVPGRPELVQQVTPLLRRLVSAQMLDLGGLTNRIDTESRTLLQPSASGPGDDETGPVISPSGNEDATADSPFTQDHPLGNSGAAVRLPVPESLR